MRDSGEYIDGKYITAEEILTLLCEVAEESELIRDSVIVFDEFTDSPRSRTGCFG